MAAEDKLGSDYKKHKLAMMGSANLETPFPKEYPSLQQLLKSQQG